jgi:hypothetical protein
MKRRAFLPLFLIIFSVALPARAQFIGGFFDAFSQGFSDALEAFQIKPMEIRTGKVNLTQMTLPPIFIYNELMLTMPIYSSKHPLLRRNFLSAALVDTLALPFHEAGPQLRFSPLALLILEANYKFHTTWYQPPLVHENDQPTYPELLQNAFDGDTWTLNTHYLDGSVILQALLLKERLFVRSHNRLFRSFTDYAYFDYTLGLTQNGGWNYSNRSWAVWIVKPEKWYVGFANLYRYLPRRDYQTDSLGPGAMYCPHWLTDNDGIIFFLSYGIVKPGADWRFLSRAGGGVVYRVTWDLHSFGDIELPVPAK